MKMDFYFNDIFIKGKRLVKGAHFSLPKNGLYIVSGNNGTGKTLLINLLFQNSIKEGKECVLVDQSSNRILYKSSTIENISFSSIAKINKDAERELDEQGFGYIKKYTPRTMSGGEKRLLCILRGLFAHPKDVLFIDEPTNDLDINVVSQLIEKIREASRITLVIIVSHDDRILKIADGTFSLIDGVLRSDTITISENRIGPVNKPTSCRKTHNNQIPILRKQFGIKWISVFLCFIFAFLVIVSLKSIADASSNRIPGIPNNQIDIYIPVSVYSEEIKEASLPIAYIPFLTGESSISEFAEAVKNDSSSTRSATFNLLLPESEKYTVYKLEYYDVNSHQNYFTAERYYELTGETNINTGGLFDFSFSIHNSKTNNNQMDYSKFVSAEKYYENNTTYYGNPYELVFCTVVLNDGYSLLDFYQCDEIKPLLDGNYYIRSNDTISIINDAALFSSQKQNTLVILFCSLVVLFIEFLFTEIYMFLGKNTIRAFRNMSVSASSIAYNIYSSTNDKLFRLISIGVMMLFCICFALYQRMQKIEIMTLYWVYFVYYIAIILFAGFIVKDICKRRTQQYADWRFR